MKKWRWGYGMIEEIEVVSETDKTLTILEKNFSGVLTTRRVMKYASGYRYFDTREEAVESFRDSLQRSLEFHERSVIDFKKKLEDLK
jgi:hypothetical protein